MMPVTRESSSPDTFFQRKQYAKGGVGALYWDYRDRIALSLLDSTDKTILDLGCGEGITLGKLVEQFPESTILGMDNLEENLEICREFDLPVRFGDVYNLDLPDDSIDAVLFMEVVEHLHEPDRAVREIWRVLRPDGKLVLVFPNDRAFKIARLVALKFREASYDPGHTRQWTPSDMAKLMETSHFEMYKTMCIPFRLWPISLHYVLTARKSGRPTPR
jgi:SAM-dependent methyltransferase